MTSDSANTPADMAEKKRIIRRMASTCTELARINKGSLGYVLKGLGGTLVSPPINLRDVQHHYGDQKRFPGVLDLLNILKHGVPINTVHKLPQIHY